MYTTHIIGFIASILVVGSSALTCAVNEALNTCGGCTSFENTCNGIKKMPNPDIMCAAVCKTQCECSKQSARDLTTNKCVSLRECTSNITCGLPHEMFIDCGGCGPNENVCPSSTVRAKRCSTLCVPKCVCAPKYSRDAATGQCVLPTQCSYAPKTCTLPNEVYNACGGCGPDEALCVTPPPPKEPTSCLAVCVEKCVCAKGFYRDATTKKCVLPSKCTIPIKS